MSDLVGEPFGAADRINQALRTIVVAAQPESSQGGAPALRRGDNATVTATFVQGVGHAIYARMTSPSVEPEPAATTARAHQSGSGPSDLTSSITA